MNLAKNSKQVLISNVSGGYINLHTYPSMLHQFNLVMIANVSCFSPFTTNQKKTNQQETSRRRLKVIDVFNLET